MPTSRIEIENVNNRWVAEVELGGLSARRSHHAAGSFAEIMAQVSGAYYDKFPEEDPARLPAQAPTPAPEPEASEAPAKHPVIDSGPSEEPSKGGPVVAQPKAAKR